MYENVIQVVTDIKVKVCTQVQTLVYIQKYTQ